MAQAHRFLTASEAARRLGLSIKALRVYEQRGLIVPQRTPAGWRIYGPEQMAIAAEIVALKALGLRLAEVGRLLADNGARRLDALAAQEIRIEGQIRRLVDTLKQVRSLKVALTDPGPDGYRPSSSAACTTVESIASVRLPWPWDDEKFELHGMKRLNYIVGPLGSGKTRLAQAIARALPDGVFVGLDRSINQPATRKETSADTDVEQRLSKLVADGAKDSPALHSLLAALESGAPNPLVIDMVEQGLDRQTQLALALCLRRGFLPRRTLFVMTRSSAILDLEAVTENEAIILCPANHSPPTFVSAYPGTPGYEAVATCLATPEVRARTEGTVACRALAP